MPPNPPEYDDPFDLNPPRDGDGVVPVKQVAIPTGLSEESDAARYLEMKFGSVGRCPNCETIYDLTVPHDSWCERCGYQIGGLDQPVIRARFKDTGA